jgi:hypothetical protein
MPGRPLTIAEVGRLFGLALPEPPGKAKCPFREHRGRKDKTFRVFRSRRTGEPIWKCWSCSDGSDNQEGVGDAIALYARLAGVDRKAAWRRLRDDGFDVPGAQPGLDAGRSGTEERDRQAYASAQREGPHTIPVTGVAPAKIRPIDKARWERWRTFDQGALAKFSKLRGIPEAFLREHGMIELPGGFVGFTYFDPRTGDPCRVKVRGVDKKMYWVEPRPPKRGPDPHDGAAPLGPLYLLNELEASQEKQPLIVTEGEIDALTLRFVGLLNVVSLPDGNESAKTVDLSLVYHRFTPWMLAFDDDTPGEASCRQILTARAYSGTDIFPVKLRRMIRTAEGDDIVGYKDANDALRAGFTRDDFVACLNMGLGRCKFGARPWRLAG